jgi:xylulokinase
VSSGVCAMEPGDASGTALWNPVTGAWSKRVIEVIDPGLMDRLPDVGRSDRLIGRISPDLARRFGLSPECGIAPGSGDNMCAAIGTGNVREGLLTVSLGTSGTACTVRREPFVDPRGEIASYRDATGAWLPLLCVSNLANGYNELLRLHGLGHGEFDSLVASTPPGNDGRLLIPWYAGERTPNVPNAAPIYVGFELASLGGSGPGDGRSAQAAQTATEPAAPARAAGLRPLCRAIIEGHVLNLHAGFSGMPVDAADVDEIRLTGGLSRSAAWRQTIADVFDVAVAPVEGEGAALGAALSAAWVWRNESGAPASIEAIVEPFVRLDETRRAMPHAEHRATYARLREYFAAVSRRMRGLEAPDPFDLRARLLESEARSRA